MPTLFYIHVNLGKLILNTLLVSLFEFYPRATCDEGQ